jgi:hypothetical protein
MLTTKQFNNLTKNNMSIKQQIQNIPNLLLVYGIIETFYNLSKDKLNKESKEHILAFISQIIDEIKTNK